MLIKFHMEVHKKSYEDSEQLLAPKTPEHLTRSWCDKDSEQFLAPKTPEHLTRSWCDEDSEQLLAPKTPEHLTRSWCNEDPRNCYHLTLNSSNV